MTKDEQQIMNAGFAYAERQCGNLAREGANAAMLAESLAIQLKAEQERSAGLEKRIAELEMATQSQDNVVPIKEPA